LGGTGKAKLVWESIRAGRDPWTDPGVTEKARGILGRDFKRYPEISASSDSGDSRTVKLLMMLEDGMEVEAVVIPNEGRPSAASKVPPRTTLCVSSQVGCNRGCIFCATGRMGFIRQLSAFEILAQVALALRVVEERGLPPLHNVVFMGMGEPLNNMANVREAVNVITDDNCFRFAKGCVTVSSVGPSPTIIKAAGDLPAMLAWSVHAAEDPERAALVPSTAHTMVELRDAFITALQTRSKSMSVFMVAVTLMEGLNDSPAHAAALVKLLQPFQEAEIKLVVNLIPYNSIGDESLSRTSKDKIGTFQRNIREAGFACFARITRGDDDAAACGQLATKSRKAVKA